MYRYIIEKSTSKKMISLVYSPVCSPIAQLKNEKN